MRILFLPLTLILTILVFASRAVDYTKLQFTDCGSQSIDIEEVDMKPMPIYNPGPAFFTFVATLKRPVKTIQVSLDIVRSVSGIQLPVKCYVLNGQNVGSCMYSDLCSFLQDILAEFQPDNCPPALAQYGIDCTCPFNIETQRLNIIDEPLDLPDASQTAASFMASGNFDITIKAYEDDSSAPAPYGCGIVKVTVKQKK